MALVRAPGADGVRVENTTGARTDWRGYTVMTSLQPYRRNRVSLDPLSASQDVTLGINSQTVTPLRGAVVLANFTTAVGRQVLFTLTRHGSPLPFGTTVTLVQENNGSDAQGQRMGIITGDAGQVYMSGMPDEGVLSVTWGEGPGSQCRIPYRLTAANMAPQTRSAYPSFSRENAREKTEPHDVPLSRPPHRPVISPGSVRAAVGDTGTGSRLYRMGN
ncbi:fimbria/pilus outer membrane usher protein [Citrobacter koseri]|uniref:fimbria/pilus outer membrane usher protein n=1 Tax=Citrobacter koseri TaxID=545 RepID=UPI00388ED13F